MGVLGGEPAGLPESVAVELRRTAAELLANVSSYADDMLEYILERVPEAGADDDLRGLTLGSCSSNLEAVLSMVRHGIDVSAATAPVTALEHARAMAARGYSVDVMLRFYRMGHAYFTERILAGCAIASTVPFRYGSADACASETPALSSREPEPLGRRVALVCER